MRPLAGGLGFEPRLTESESAVLPLNYPPIPFCFNNLDQGRRALLAPCGGLPRAAPAATCRASASSFQEQPRPASLAERLDQRSLIKSPCRGRAGEACAPRWSSADCRRRLLLASRQSEAMHSSRPDARRPPARFRVGQPHSPARRCGAIPRRSRRPLR
jgi:hypothetical protein